jgi:hypothetical protein
MSNSDLITAAAYYESSSHSTITRAQYATQPAKENWMKKTQNFFFLFAMDFVPFVPNRTPTQKKGKKKEKQSERTCRFGSAKWFWPAQHFCTGGC